ncbi:hypothetical protein HNY73_004900 [Argiope bruennichi]|uniref:Uncharacterized protein n=1 Tax=Argiope bruennichi TaxID=94029 RepID=A0A8T0FT78_ARGBR|nr:hypothetical protein HNY73_004900 [Argiope bruennichi]
MSEGVVVNGYVYLKVDEKTFMMEERSGRHPWGTDELFRQLMQKFVKIDVSQWRSCLLIFHRFLRLFLYEDSDSKIGVTVSSVHDGCPKFFRPPKSQRMASALDFLSRYGTKENHVKQNRDR